MIVTMKVSVSVNHECGSFYDAPCIRVKVTPTLAEEVLSESESFASMPVLRGPMLELRWATPSGTTTQPPRLQWRSRKPYPWGQFTLWTDWTFVPTVVIP